MTCLTIQERAYEIIRYEPEIAACIHRTLSMRERVDAACNLTKRQRDLLQFIQDYNDKHGICPSYDEMREGIGLNSKSGIHRLVKALEKRGHVTAIANHARSLRLEVRI